MLFLFAPTLLASVCIFTLLNTQLQTALVDVEKVRAQALVEQVARLVLQYPGRDNGRALKSRLQAVEQSRDLSIDNIVIYDAQGRFLNARNLSPGLINSRLGAFPEPAYYPDERFYHGYGRIAVNSLGDRAQVSWVYPRDFRSP